MVHINAGAPPATLPPGPVDGLDAATGAQRWVVAGPDFTTYSFGDGCPTQSEGASAPAVVGTSVLFVSHTYVCSFLGGRPEAGETATALGPSTVTKFGF